MVLQMLLVLSYLLLLLLGVGDVAVVVNIAFGVVTTLNVVVIVISVVGGGDVVALTVVGTTAADCIGDFIKVATAVVFAAVAVARVVAFVVSPL